MLGQIPIQKTKVVILLCTWLVGMLYDIQMIHNLKLHVVVGIEYKNSLCITHIHNISLYVCVVYKCVFVCVWFCP